jgi:thiamine-phosphate pyrophosphorylase
VRSLGVPLISLVTDRQRLTPPTDDDLVRLAGSAAAAGVNLIQVRERRQDVDDRALLALTLRIVAAAAATPAAVVVNDRVDIAIAARCAGVHLRGDSVGAERVRAVSPAGFIVGRSVHSVAEARDAVASGADYVIMGTVYPSKSKAASAAAGLDGLKEVCRAVPVPVLAIGGITLENIHEVAAAGAGGIAAIGLFSDLLSAHGPLGMDDAMAAVVATIRGAFSPFVSDGGSAS